MFKFSFDKALYLFIYFEHFLFSLSHCILLIVISLIFTSLTLLSKHFINSVFKNCYINKVYYYYYYHGNVFNLLSNGSNDSAVDTGFNWLDTVTNNMCKQSIKSEYQIKYK